MLWNCSGIAPSHQTEKKKIKWLSPPPPPSTFHPVSQSATHRFHPCLLLLLSIYFTLRAGRTEGKAVETRLQRSNPSNSAGTSSSTGAHGDYTRTLPPPLHSRNLQESPIIPISHVCSLQGSSKPSPFPPSPFPPSPFPPSPVSTLPRFPLLENPQESLAMPHDSCGFTY